MKFLFASDPSSLHQRFRFIASWKGKRVSIKETTYKSGSDALIERIDRQFAQNGWGFWALEEKQSSCLIGLCGIAPIIWDAPFGKAIELSWRLSASWQGRGMAREAAEASIHFGLRILKLERLVAFTVPANEASWRLMERLRMRKLGYFDYAALPEPHPLRRQVLYEITAEMLDI